MSPRLTRRRFVGTFATGAVLAGSSVPAFAKGGTPGLGLIDPSLGAVAELALKNRFASGEIVELAPDLVRQWRDGLYSCLRQHGGAIALSRWSGVQVLEGLAREAGGRTDVRRFGSDGFEVQLVFPR
ncbi:MAG: hypothetical protein WA957_17775 [Alteraurantiacibacter sp.]